MNEVQDTAAVEAQASEAVETAAPAETTAPEAVATAETPVAPKVRAQLPTEAAVVAKAISDMVEAQADEQETAAAVDTTHRNSNIGWDKSLVEGVAAKFGVTFTEGYAGDEDEIAEPVATTEPADGAEVEAAAETETPVAAAVSKDSHWIFQGARAEDAADAYNYAYRCLKKAKRAYRDTLTGERAERMQKTEQFCADWVAALFV